MANEFQNLCDLLPADVYWGDPVTPEIVREIESAVRSREHPVRQVAEQLAAAASLVLMRAREQPGPYKLLIDGGSLSEALKAYKNFKQGEIK